MLSFWLTYWPHIALVASTIIGVVAAVHAAMTKDDVRAATGWVGVILFSPVIGAFLYLVAGINRIRQSTVGQRRAEAEGPHSMGEGVPGGSPACPVEDDFVSLRRLGDQVGRFPLTAGNRVELLAGGDEAYPAMLAAVRAARRSIVMATYIFDNDPIGRELADALIEAHGRGVAVRVLIDAVGARYSRPPITRHLRKGGIVTALFLGNIIGFRLPYANLRSHRKILVVDGEIAFTGGMNIRASFMRALAGDAFDRDTHFRVEGPAVAQLQTVFMHDWLFATGERLDGQPWARLAPPLASGGVALRVVPSGPDRNLAATHSMIMGALAVAQERVRICSPYFLPDQQLIGALAVAARRGLLVDIVIPSANNLKLVDYAMTAQLDQVIGCGCRVWRASGAFDHSKLLAVDGAWAYVGSSNLDPRSLRLNFELDLEIHDRATAVAVEARIEEQIKSAAPETMATLKARPFIRRLRNRAIWLASPYL
jgi:cardiolipin synthase